MSNPEIHLQLPVTGDVWFEPEEVEDWAGLNSCATLGVFHWTLLSVFQQVPQLALYGDLTKPNTPNLPQYIALINNRFHPNGVC